MRLLTILAVLGACAFAVMRGFEVIGFGVAEPLLQASGSPAQGVARWQATAGLGVPALKASLARSAPGAGPADLRERADLLAALLTRRPLSASDWLSLAGVRAAASAPDEEVVAATTMSYLTGPNEGAVMVQRGIFGLIRWDALPATVRAQAARDLGGAMFGASIRPAGLQVIRAILAGKSRETRAEIAGMLAGEQISAAQLARLGL
jgi:hypothetical protein